MPIETATYISDLVTSNPASSDGLNGADDHMRLIKGTLKTTFPNITGALNASHTQLDAAATATSNGTGVLNDAGVFFKTNNKDGLTNPAAGKVALVATDGASTPAQQTIAEFTGSDKRASFKGPIDAAGAITGPGVIPIGTMVMWLNDTLPTVGKWCWANGGTLPRTGDGAALFALWGTKYGTGDGSTTFNVINMQEVVPVGKSAMGSAASPGLLSSIASNLKTTLGAVFGTDTHKLTAAQIASHRHVAPIYDPGHSHGGTLWTPGSSTGFQGGSTWSDRYQWFGSSINSAPTNVRVRSNDGTFDATDTTGGDQAHPNTQPSAVVNFIIRIG